LHVAGYLSKSDEEYLRNLERRAATGKLADKFRYHGEPDREQKVAFLQSLHVFSTPTVYPESKGLPALEAMANGVPVVLPNHGSFPEMVAATEGGILFEPHNAADLADKLAKLLQNPTQADDLGKAGRKTVSERFHATAMADKTRQLYQQLTATAS
jgi:glycosyltransferase involved in cell wall biosynthesis